MMPKNHNDVVNMYMMVVIGSYVIIMFNDMLTNALIDTLLYIGLLVCLFLSNTTSCFSISFNDAIIL